MFPSLPIAMVGCSHRHTRLSVRERLTFTPEQAVDALAAWRVTHPEQEAVLISTCNRVELYAATSDPSAPIDPPALTHFLTDFHNVPIDEAQQELTSLQGSDVVRHLFRVAASLDSMVLGEAQILAQVKQAYELANKIGSSGPLTHGCFQAAIRVARRIANETDLHRHRVSIPSVAVGEVASRVFERFDDKHVLVIGAGKMARETLRYLADAGSRKITVLNRDFERAQSLAAEWNGKAVPWDELHQRLVKADLVISTTGADRHIVSLTDFKQHVSRGRQQRPLFVLDLAMPRDFDPAIADELGVYLYSIDDLTEACEQNRQNRASSLPQAEAIIEEEVRTFIADAHHRASGPVIARFREGLQNLQSAELSRLYARLPDLDDRSRREVQLFADRLLAKMLHPPLESLRDGSRNGTAHGLLEALQQLFQLKDKDD
jgi:glutamyl-tRNA reductase